MKKLGSFNINPKNIMTHDELLSIKGGKNNDRSACNNQCQNNSKACYGACSACVDNPTWAGMKVCVD